MKIQEQDLLKLGFEKIEVPIEESGDKPYEYFTYDIGDLCLITCASDECVDGCYTVEFFDYPNSVVFTNLTVLEDIITLLNENRK